MQPGNRNRGGRGINAHERPSARENAPKTDGSDPSSSAFVDLQCNGRMGLDFAAAGLTLDGVRRVTLDLAASGTIAYCPTVTTGDPEIYRRNLAVLARACEDDGIGPHLLGIHLEGPFISSQPGARGAHPGQFIRPPSRDDFDRFQEWAGGHIRILTVAPEIDGMPDLIRHAVARGVTVSLGHHLAGDDALQRAVEAGARCCTHLGNGLPETIARHRNPLWWQLACDRLDGMFITDGWHLPAPLIKVMLRAKTPARFIVVSDASPVAGMPPGRYRAFGQEVVVRADGRIDAVASGTLAGSSADMTACMRHLAGLGLLDEDGLWRVGRDNPLRLLGLDAGRIAGLPGARFRYDGLGFIPAD